MLKRKNLRVYLYVPAEGRVVMDELADLPAAGALLAWDGRQYRVTAVHEHPAPLPAVLSLESSALQLPASTSHSGFTLSVGAPV